jgi:hypothetical protein
MRKIFMAVVAAVAILMSGLVGTQTASAAELPPDASGYKFWSPNICVEAGNGIPDNPADQTYYRVAYIAQQWNLRTTILSLDYSADCAADGYPPSRRMVIGTYSNPTDTESCMRAANVETEGLNGFARWTNGPAIYIRREASCASAQVYRDHAVSQAIGYLLGLKILNSSGYNSRVMNNTTWSWQNVPLPDQNSGNTLSAIYAYAYCQPFGTVC